MKQILLFMRILPISIKLIIITGSLLILNGQSLSAYQNVFLNQLLPWDLYLSDIEPQSQAFIHLGENLPRKISEYNDLQHNIRTYNISKNLQQLQISVKIVTLEGKVSHEIVTRNSTEGYIETTYNDPLLTNNYKKKSIYELDRSYRLDRLFEYTDDKLTCEYKFMYSFDGKLNERYIAISKGKYHQKNAYYYNEKQQLIRVENFELSEIGTDRWDFIQAGFRIISYNQAGQVESIKDYGRNHEIQRHILFAYDEKRRLSEKVVWERISKADFSQETPYFYWVKKKKFHFEY